MKHGNSNNLQVNFFQNSAKIYWTDKMRLETVGKMNELQTRYASIVEKLVPLMTSFLTFELHCFFLQTRFVQFIQKRHNKNSTRYQERNYASNFEQKLRSNFTHTQPTPHTDTTTHHTLTHKQMYTSTPEQMYTSTTDNVRAALLVAV